MKSLYVGINVGSISIKITTIDETGEIVSKKIVRHKGQPREILEKIKRESRDPKSITYYGVSGHSGHLAESNALEAALQHQNKNYDAVISLGGEAFVVFLLKNNTIQNVLSHNRCAAGSGEFLIQQVARLNLSLEEAINMAMTGKSIKLASRCSVHCKSDITHKLNRKEANLNDILWSLHEAMAQKIVSLLDKVNSQISSILVIGGVSQNNVMITLLKELIPNSDIVVSPQSSYIEAYGTALLAKQSREYTSPQYEFKPLFQSLPTLRGVEDLVTIIQPEELKLDQPIDKISEPLILGIDGGSTTTKAALITKFSHKIVSSKYTKTNGDPIAAAKECISSIIEDVGNQEVILVATTGSARELIGAFVGTPAVYNEISAHATGALAFDNEVDTIFEIGGQDAKYIYIQNGAPIDYAMNAACSAGTGSFLEESAQGDLGISVYDISSIALNSPAPIQFQADCAAFINSDIRSALQDGYSNQDIIGGLVSSIVTNYLTKVKGRRRVGKKVFFQGGVAKNNSVAYVFAQATKKEIIVPPYPELMGAYGVALLALQYNDKNDLQFQSTTLKALMTSEMKFLGDFICRTCDNYCTINRYIVAGRKFPFGGKCSKYENQWKNTSKQDVAEDFIKRRNDLIFSVVDKDQKEFRSKLTIGIPRALTTHSLLPLFYTFFQELGMRIIISDIDEGGQFKTNAPFCFPMQIAHGAILDLQKQDNEGKISLDYVFFPQIQKMPNGCDEGLTENTYLCPITQSSPFVIKKAFPDLNYLSPALDFHNGYSSTSEMINMAVNQLGIDWDIAQLAFTTAVASQIKIEKKLRALGKEALNSALSSNKAAIIVVGRSYNAFPKETSQSISIKLASKGVIAIPYDCLSIHETSDTSWYFSNLILDAVKLSEQHENLFMLYVSNFGCNIDSFTQEYVKKQIGNKPYLKLDIDSHTADAGTQTRLEAFLEIVSNYRYNIHHKPKSDFQVTKTFKSGKKFLVKTTNGESISLYDERVKIYFPSFSKFHNETLSMAMRWLGMNAPQPIELTIDQLNTGLQHTAGTECLPFPIYLGQILELYNNKKPSDILGFYIMEQGAPCVIASYSDLIEKFIEDLHLENTFLYLPKAENEFLGLDKLSFSRYFPFAIGLADVMTEVNNVLAVIGYQESGSRLRNFWEQFIISSSSKKEFDSRLDDFLLLIKDFPLKKPAEECAKVLVTGDFFVRFDEFFYQGLVEKYAEHDIILKPVDLNELLIYSAYAKLHLNQGLTKEISITGKTFLKTIPKCFTTIGRQMLGSLFSIKLLEHFERKIRDKFQSTGLIDTHSNDMESVLESASDHLDLSIYGESVLTVGKGVETLMSEYDGMLLLGPFSCLPFRISESILKPLYLENNFPFLTFETDARSIPPAFLRLVDIHIQQINRQRKINNSSLILLKTV